MSRALAALLLLPFFAQTLRAQTAPKPRSTQRGLVIDDSDLAGPPASDVLPRLRREARTFGKVIVFRARALPGAAQNPPPSSGRFVTGTLSLTDAQGRAQPGRQVEMLLVGPNGVVSKTETDDAGEWSLPLPAGAQGQAAVHFRLENRLWSIQDPDGTPYEWEAGTVVIPSAGSVAAGAFTLDANTANGKIGFIHLQLLQGMNVFAREGIPTDFWKRRLRVTYPGQGDYTSPYDFSLNLSQAEAWDVNLHEFGHAVMAAGIPGSGGGGQHYIDRCYDEALAWSEGWASFFAGVAGVARDDADAKFQYMVPRRAPIRIENVPADVCAGPANEWRVTAGLWDLYDTHVDGPDVIALPFARIWGALRGQSVNTFGDAWSLIQKGLSSQESKDATAALQFNTLLPASVAEARTLALPIFTNAPTSPQTAPNWDGLFAR